MMKSRFYLTISKKITQLGLKETSKFNNDMAKSVLPNKESNAIKSKCFFTSFLYSY
jgi:hypothetical protein